MWAEVGLIITVTAETQPRCDETPLIRSLPNNARFKIQNSPHGNMSKFWRNLKLVNRIEITCPNAVNPMIQMRNNESTNCADTLKCLTFGFASKFFNKKQKSKQCFTFVSDDRKVLPCLPMFALSLRFRGMGSSADRMSKRATIKSYANVICYIYIKEGKKQQWKFLFRFPLIQSND